MTEKTAQEIANEEMERAIARGDYLEGEEPETTSDTEDDQGIDDSDNDTEDTGANDDSDQDSDSASGHSDDGEDDDAMDDDEGDGDSDLDDSVEDDSEEDYIEEEGDEDENSEEEDSQSNLKDTRIPKARLDKVIAQREAEKEKTKWLEEQLAKALDNKPTETSEATEEEAEVEVYDFDAAEEAYIEHLLGGATKEAAELRSQINREHAKVTRAQMQEITEAAKEEAAQSVADAKFTSVVESLEEQYPFLDEQHDDYNEEAVDTINSLMSGYIANGQSNDAALLKAVKTMAPIYTPDTPVEETVAVKKGGTSKRTAKARAKKVRASNQQPASMGQTSKGSKNVDTEVSISSLSEKEFTSLTAKERAILRGDVI